MTHSLRSETGWRPIGYWGMTINVCVLPVAIGIGPIIWPSVDFGMLAQLYPYILGGWCGAAGIRQWGKNSGSEFGTSYGNDNYGGNSWSA